MSTSTRKRGRPRGSGIDDTRILQEILELLDRNPKMKPTTAIRTLGIENESVIRRLRDKIRAMVEQDLQPVARRRQPAVPVQSEPQVATATVNLAVPREEAKRSERSTEPKAVTCGPESSGTINRPEETSNQRDTNSELGVDPISRLPMALFAASFSAAQFIALQNVLYFQAGIRHATKDTAQRGRPTTCPNCVHQTH